jgi:autotransporter-associated beta strand protein
MGADNYWDSNGTTAGTANTSGSWSEGKWSTDSAGGSATGVFSPAGPIFFSAGTNGTGAFTITIDGGSRDASGGITIEEGTVTFNTAASGNIVALGAGTLRINSGALLSVDNASGFFETSHTLGGGGVILDGGTLRNSNASAGSTFYSANATIGLGTGGTGTLDLSGGVAIIWQGAGLIGTEGSGATTANGGAGTFTKVGTGEFRYQGAGTAASTYAKLVVTGGLFRTGSTAGSSELGFGAAPTASLADAITLNGGGIGTTATTTLHANRGITVGAGGGTINTIGTLTVPGLLSGTGQLTAAAGTTVFQNAGNNASFGGSINVTGATAVFTLSQSLTATQLTGTGGTVSVASSRIFNVGNNNANTTYAGIITGAGTFTKVGSGILTMSPAAAEWANTGGVTISAGTLKFGTSAMGFASTVTVTVNNGGTLDMNNINDTFGTLAGTAGGVVTAGTGNISLAGTQSTTYSGSITTTTGDLTKTATSTGTTALNGVVTVDALTMAGVGGTLTLGAANTINTVALNAGRLNINNNTGAGTAPITVANVAGTELTSSSGTVSIANDITLNGAGANAVTMYSSGTALTVAGVISGAGGIIRNNTGAGTLTLAGNNNFAGGVQIISRGVVVGHQNALGIGTLTLGDTVTAPANAITISSNTNLTGASAVPNAITVNRDFTISGINDFELSGAVDLGGASRIVTVTNTMAPILSGVVGGATGSAVVKAGTGTLVLTNANTYDGGTTVSAGRLRVNNTTGSGTGSGAVTVSGGSLSGNGFIGGATTVQTGGTLAPGGATPGVLTFNGALTLDAGSIMSYRLGTSSDSANITTASGLTLDSGTNTITLNFSDSGGLAAGSYTLLDYNTAFNGNLGSIVIGTNPGGFNFSVVDNTTNTSIDLVVAAIGGPNEWKDQDGTWGDTANWTNAVVPNAAADTATFGLLATAPRSVTVEANKTVGTLEFNNTNKYTVSGSGQIHIAGAGVVTNTLGSHDVTAPVVLDAATTVTVTAGALKMTDLTATGQALTKAGAGTLEVDKVRSSAALTVSAGTLKMTSSGGNEQGLGTKNSHVTSLSMTNGSTIDLTNNNLIIEATDFADSQTKYTAAEALVKSGFGNFDWLGTGIVSSTAAAAAQIDGSRALGIINNNDWGHGDIEGDAVGPNDIIISYTWVGDANVDGLVDNDDFGQFLAGFSGSPAQWVFGDFDYNGVIDNDDFGWFLTGLTAFQSSGNTQLDAGFQAQLAAFASEQGIPLVLEPQAVPEPTTLGVIGVVGAGMLARRRRKA